ncbi:GNAT family N-acetyltransferase [Specibacter cremeus]|uniref:GNAT family N-acetyltransferase n=1 Tax=Specibacter cremeus TaxID=1629051 RepID=UPI000F76FC44|nr:GNAT family N-acetyltransferase [Specibacter cremeus]
MTTDRTTVLRHPRAFPYELRSFPSRLEDGEVPGRLLQWIQAAVFGFYGEAPDPEDMRKFVESEQVDGRVVVGAYLVGTETPAGAWDASIPVATYAYHRKDLNVGAPARLPVHMITAVTVRASHRRRGILRAMITSDLAQAKAAGLPMAALTASEAVIYGRFGFGTATHHCSVEVAAKGGLVFQNAAAAHSGVVEVAEPAVVADLHDDVFARVHAGTYGSIGRQDLYRSIVSGQGGYEHPKKDPAVRAALHYDAAGGVDGYVTYKVDERDPAGPTAKVVDVLAVDSSAYLALWNYLGSLDLIERVTWTEAPENDPLEWAIVNKRDYRRTETEDHLWLRILDVPRSLSARRYWADGELTLHVTDPLGHVSGTYRISVAAGAATVLVVDEDDDADLALGVAELSSLYFGNVLAHTLAAAGRVREQRAGALAEFDLLFGSPVRAHSLTDF